MRCWSFQATKCGHCFGCLQNLWHVRRAIVIIRIDVTRPFYIRNPSVDDLLDTVGRKTTRDAIPFSDLEAKALCSKPRSCRPCQNHSLSVHPGQWVSPLLSIARRVEAELSSNGTPGIVDHDKVTVSIRVLTRAKMSV